MLLCKDLWGALQLPIMLSLMEGVIYLLHPLRSAMLTSTTSGQTQTIVCSEQVVKNFLLITCWLVQHRSLCSTHLVTILYRQLLSRSGETPVMDNKIMYKVLFLHRGKTYQFLPHKDLGIHGRDQFPCQGL
jgi:hypothetical protein